MKKLIPLIAIALAMAVPAVMSAQTPDYYGYENPDKTVLIEWVEDAINADNIPFTSTGEKDAFLALIDTLYAKRDAEDWSQCVSVAAQLYTATVDIVDGAKAELAELCEWAGVAYTYPGNWMIVSPNDEEVIQDLLVYGGSSAAVGKQLVELHVPEESDCTPVRCGRNQCHLDECDGILVPF